MLGKIIGLIGILILVSGIVFLVFGILILVFSISIPNDIYGVFLGLFLVALSCFLIVISIKLKSIRLKIIRGKNRTFESYMNNLPCYVKNTADAKNLFNKSGDSMLFVEHEVAKALKLIENGEPIYLMVAPTVTITDKSGTQINGQGLTPGVVFVSSKRFVFIEHSSLEVYEIPLYGIRSVAAKNIVIREGISFSTGDVVVKVSSGALHFQSNFVREMLIELAATASPPQTELKNAEPVTVQTSEFPSSSQISYRAKAVGCKGCGAAVIVHYNAISVCEYCGRPVEYK